MDKKNNESAFSGKDHAKLYSKFRPVYPMELFSAIIHYCKKEEDFEFCKALDIGCGSGQSTFQLAEYFQHVVGYDISEAQIEEAKRKDKHQFVEFKVGAAEHLPEVADSSIDLVTFASSLHWVDFKKAYLETKRILKEKGVIAVYMHDAYNVKTSEKVRILTDTFHEEIHFPSYSPQMLIHLGKYHDFDNMPFSDFTRDETMSMYQTMTPSSLMGMYHSLATIQEMIREKPGTEAELETLEMKIKDVLKEEGALDEDNPSFVIEWHINLLLGRNSK